MARARFRGVGEAVALSYEEKVGYINPMDDPACSIGLEIQG